MNNLEKVFLIDGMALIYRSYYAMIRNPLVSSSGQQLLLSMDLLDLF